MMTEITEDEIVGLEFRHDREAENIGIRLLVSVNLESEPFGPATHVVQVVATRGLGTGHEDQGGRRTMLICDPGSLLRTEHRKGLDVLLNLAVKGCWVEIGSLCELVRCDDD